MGFSPAQVGAMSEWEFAVAASAWIEANCPPDDNATPPSPDEHDAMVEMARHHGHLH